MKLIISSLALALLLCTCVAAGPSVLSQVTSLNAESEHPRFSWALDHTDRSQAQQAYQIILYSAQSGVFWDSGRVVSSQTQFISYTGPSLSPYTVYSWSVRWWDLAGEESPLSKPVSFETGIGSWDGSEWITSGLKEALMRKDFTLNKSIVSARLYTSGLGWFDVSINGQRVTDYFGNGWTTFRKRLLYNIIDVTSVVKSGDNAIGAATAMGWADWSAFPSKTGGSEFPPPTIRLLLRVEYADGTVGIVGTDASWTFGESPVTAASVYNGEDYDARLEQPGWDSTGFKPKHAWKPVKVSTSPTAMVTRMVHPAIKVIDTFKPVAITEPQPGVYVVKFPHNFSGMCRLKVKGKAGHKVTLRHAEVLIHPPYSGQVGMIYTENLRSAKATDTYILRGDPQGETFSPRFTYHGFQYVEVTNYPGELTLDDIDAVFVASDIPQRGFVSFNNEVLNNFQDRALRGQRANLMSIPTDCNQRDERLGWSGDANLSGDSLALNFDILSFFSNYLRLIRDEQGEEGSIPDVVPSARYASRPSDPSWGGVYPTLVWVLHRYFADLAPAEEHIEGISAYVAWLDKSANATGLKNMFATFGDWCPAPPSPRISMHLTASYSYILSVKQLADLENALGHSSKAKDLSDHVIQLGKMFEEAFWDPKNQTSDINMQSDMAISLSLGVAAPTSHLTLAKELIDDLLHKNDLHFTTGIIGAKVLFPVLEMLNRSDIAFDVLAQVSYPSFGYAAFNGIEPADTLWELMDAPVEGPGMNSRNHHMFSSPSGYLYSLAGLGGAGPEFSRPSLTPNPMPGLSAASVKIESGRGTIAFSWTHVGGKICDKVAENRDLTLSCGTGGVISSISGSYGTPTGGCATGFSVNPTCHSQSTLDILSKTCIGKESCTIRASNEVFSDPCFQHMKLLIASAECSNPPALGVTANLPVGSSATVKLPTLGHALSEIIVREQDIPIFKNGVFAEQKQNGIFAAEVVEGAIQLEIGSGNYNFQVSI